MNNKLILGVLISIFLAVGIAQAALICNHPLSWDFDNVNVQGCAGGPDNCPFFTSPLIFKALGGAADKVVETMTVTNNEIGAIVLNGYTCAGNLDLVLIPGGDVNFIGNGTMLPPGNNTKFAIAWDVPANGETKGAVLCMLRWEYVPTGDMCTFEPTFTGAAFPNTFVSNVPSTGGPWTVEWGTGGNALQSDSSQSNTIILKQNGIPVFTADVTAVPLDPQPIDLVNLVAESNPALGIAVAHQTGVWGTDAPELSNRQIYVPKTTGLWYHCPDATILSEVSTACSNIDLDPTVTEVNIGGNDYGKMDNQGGGNGPGGSSVPEFSDIAWVLAAVLGAGSFVLIRKMRKF